MRIDSFAVLFVRAPFLGQDAAAAQSCHVVVLITHASLVCLFLATVSESTGQRFYSLELLRNRPSSL
jgi:hypothetical protein